MSRFIDRAGAKNGSLFVESLSHFDSRSQAYWNCRCECGALTVVRGSRLKPGGTVSCGCVNPSRFKVDHGLCGTDLYKIWNAMIQRCHNPDCESFERYGGRGIEVCQEWRDSPQKFASDMGERPSQNHSIERRDNDKGYCKGNCYWATRREQGRNKRNNLLHEIDGVTRTLSEWCEKFGADYNLVYQRLYRQKRKWSLCEALGV